MNNWFYLTVGLQQFVAGVWSIKEKHYIWGLLLIQYALTNITLLFLQGGGK